MWWFVGTAVKLRYVFSSSIKYSHTLSDTETTHCYLSPPPQQVKFMTSALVAHLFLKCQGQVFVWSSTEIPSLQTLLWGSSVACNVHSRCYIKQPCKQRLSSRIKKCSSPIFHAVLKTSQRAHLFKFFCCSNATPRPDPLNCSVHVEQCQLCFFSGGASL